MAVTGDEGDIPHVVETRAERFWRGANVVLAGAGLLAIVAIVYTFFRPATLQQYWLSTFRHPFPLDINYLRDFLTFSDVIDALGITISLGVASMAAGVVLGFVAGFARMSRLGVVRVITFLYVGIWRGTPLLLQLLMVAFGLPILLESMDPSGSGPLTSIGRLVGANPYLAGFIALTLYEGAYMAEIVRAGLLSVDHGQVEAAKALGMNPVQAMRHVVLPQALRVILPPTGNNFIAILKDTSLVSVIGLSELTLVAEETYSRNFRVLEVLIGAAVYYLALTTLWTVIQAGIESRIGTRSEAGTRARGLAGKSLRALGRRGAHG